MTKILKKLSSFGIVRLFDILHYSQFCQFSYLPFDINLFRSFIYAIFYFLFGLNTFVILAFLHLSVPEFLNMRCQPFQNFTVRNFDPHPNIYRFSITLNFLSKLSSHVRYVSTPSWELASSQQSSICNKDQLG